MYSLFKSSEGFFKLKEKHSPIICRLIICGAQPRTICTKTFSFSHGLTLESKFRIEGLHIWRKRIVFLVGSSKWEFCSQLCAEKQSSKKIEDSLWFYKRANLQRTSLFLVHRLPYIMCCNNDGSELPKWFGAPLWWTNQHHWNMPNDRDYFSDGERITAIKKIGFWNILLRPNFTGHCNNTSDLCISSYNSGNVVPMCGSIIGGGDLVIREGVMPFYRKSLE